MTMILRTALASLGLLVVAAGGTACGDETACTAMACANLLTLEVVDGNGDPLTTFSGQLEADGATIDIDCPAGTVDQTARCVGDGRVEITTGAQTVQLTITGGGLAFNGSLDPSYQTVQPNGPQCLPTCKQATETVILQ